MTRFPYERGRDRLEVWHERYAVDASGCWVWQGHCQPKGYGTYYANGRSVLAHRWGYEQLRGPIPDGLQIDHLCRNKPCVNPDHLEVVTGLTNIRRAAPFYSWRDPSHCPAGHEYTDANTYNPPSRPSVKMCRTCRTERQSEQTRKRRVRNGLPEDGRPQDTCRNGHVDQRDARGKCVPCRQASVARYRAKLRKEAA